MKLSRCFLISFAVICAQMLCHQHALAKIPDDVVEYYKQARSHHANKIVPVYKRFEGQKHVTTTIVSDSCRELLPFAIDFITWANITADGKHSAPTCECDDSVCAIELTEYFPKYFVDKIQNKMPCNGANCFNTTLIAIGFLSSDQFRYSSEHELAYYLTNHCTSVPVGARQAMDIVTTSDVKDVFAMHAGLYINNDILFTKAGPAKTSLFSLEDWSKKFELQSDLIRVFRCKPEPRERNKSLSMLEKVYSDIYDDDASETEISEQLDWLDHVTSTLFLPDYSSPTDVYALSSLRTSISSSKLKQVMIRLPCGQKMLLPESILRVYKKSLDDAIGEPYTSYDELAIGDYVALHAYEYGEAGALINGKDFYKVVEKL